MICKICGELKQRMRSEKPGTNPCYRDENGKRWNGTICPACIRIQTNSRQEGYRAAPNTAKRKCRGCSRRLPLDKYFYHVACGPGGYAGLDYRDMSEEYGFYGS